MALKMQNGRYFNEDGNDNELTADVAGWLNYFLNGVNVVHGSGLSDEPGTGTYSNCFAIARNETFLAGAGNDKIWSGDGDDKVMGGIGADKIYLWENAKVADTLIFAVGESGKTWPTMDSVEGFQSGVDKIDLRAMGAMTFADLDYVAGGKKSCYYDGHFLRIDYTGDGATDMMVEFKYLAGLAANDFVFI